MDGILEVERPRELREVVGVGIEVISLPRLAGAAMAAAVVGDAAVAARGQKQHLVLECIGAEGPTVAEDDWSPLAPVVVMKLHPVLGGNGRHPVLVCV